VETSNSHVVINYFHWYKEVVNDIRLRKNLFNRLDEIERIVGELNAEIINDNAKGESPDTYARLISDVYKLKNEILELI
jgi:hypothetical protein